MTPKIAKGTYDNRFNSSPVISLEEEKKDPEKEPLLSSLKIVSPIRSKTSLNSVGSE